MNKKPSNQFADEAVLYIKEIEDLRSGYEQQKECDIKSRAALDHAKNDVSNVLSDLESDVETCASRLTETQAKLQIIAHRYALTKGGLETKLFDLAERVDGAEGFLIASSSYLARDIRSRKAQEIAVELGVNIAKIDREMIVIKGNPKALAAEALTAPSRFSHQHSFGKLGELEVFSRSQRVLPRLKALAEFENPAAPLPL